MMRPLIDGSTSYGINISRPETSAFLVREYGIDKTTIQSATPKVSRFSQKQEVRGSKIFSK